MKQDHTNTRFSQLCCNHGTINCRYSVPTWHSTIHPRVHGLSVHACPHLQVGYWQILAHLDDYKIANYKCRETKQPCRGSFTFYAYYHNLLTQLYTHSTKISFPNIRHTHSYTLHIPHGITAHTLISKVS